MEYIAALPADERVRFYVYAPGDPATAGKLKFADLDGLGPKPVPHLCHICHGGSYDSASHLAKNARFREFDLPSFRYSLARQWDFSGANNNSLNNTELTNFTTLNKLVRDIAPASSPIQLLIDNWYTTGYVGAKKPVLPTPPSGWSGQVNGYHNVYAKSCRTCHVARDAPNDFSFSDSGDFSFTDYAVCQSPKIMPNAFVTYKNFWSDTQRVIDYKNLTGAGTCQ
jgi:cytochrome c5